MTASTKYAIVLSSTNAGLRWQIDSSSPSYSGGESMGSTDSGTTYAIESGFDNMFETYGISTAGHIVVTTLTTAKPDGSYNAGKEINFTVNFNSTAVVTGSPVLEIETGTTDRNATYSSGSGSSALIFNYTVQAGDTSSDLTYKATDSLQLNGGTIKDMSGNSATLTLPAPTVLSGLHAIIIDTTAPTVSTLTTAKPDGSYNADKEINFSVNFDSTVIVTGSPVLEIETGTTDRNATYVTGSGSTSLTFNYTVQAGDTSSDLTYKATDSLQLNGGTIVDIAGNSATLTLPAPTVLSGLHAIIIDTTPPTIVSARLTPSSGIVVSGSEVNMTITTSQTGLSMSAITLNGKTVTNFVDLGNTSYRVNYTIATGDTSRTAGTIPTSIVLSDLAGNTNSPFTTLTTNTLIIGDKVTITFYDGSTFVHLAENKSITLSVTPITIGNSTSISMTNYTKILKLIHDQYNLQYTATGYNLGSQTFNPNITSITSLNLYLMNVSNSIIFTLKDADSGSTLESATMKVYQSIAGVYSLVYQHDSDVAGRIQFYYSPTATYRFDITKTGYFNKSFIQNPVIYDTGKVNILMTSSTGSSQTAIGIKQTLSPDSLFKNARSNNLSVQFSSPSGKLIGYWVNVTYPGGTSTKTGAVSTGGTLVQEINITGAVLYDKVYITSYYQLVGETTKHYTKNSYYVIISPGNYTIAHNKSDTYGLGVFERTLISTMILFVIGGMAIMIMGGIAGGSLGLVLMGYMVAIGFMPIGIAIISFIVGGMIVFWRSSQ